MIRERDIDRRYRDCAAFHAMVEALRGALSKHQLSIDDVREAANLAINLYVVTTPTVLRLVDVGEAIRAHRAIERLDADSPVPR